MFKNPFSFNGRIRRTEFGISYALTIFFVYGYAIILEYLNIGGYQILIILTAIYWFLFAQSAKRCHDLGNNGFYQIIPFYVFALIFSEGQNRNNRYGSDPKTMELEVVTLPSHTASNKLIFPERKSKEAIGSELLSGILITTLASALVSYFLSNDGWVYFIIESILIIAGYLTVLLISFKMNPLPHLPIYFILHRAIFSAGWYLCIVYYEVFSNNITDIDFSSIGGDITYVLSTFILTYIPYLIYKYKKPNLIPLET